MRNFHLPKLDATIHFRLTNPEALGPDDRLFCLVIYEYDDLEHDQVYGVGALNAPDLIESTYTTASDQFTYVRTTKVICSRFADKKALSPSSIARQ
jgi:hypothetical protein